MIELADIIVNKIIEKQKEYDEAFKDQISSMVEGTAYQINETADDIINITNNSIVLIILEDQLKAALEAEDYEKASELKKKIDKIKNTSNNF